MSLQASRLHYSEIVATTQGENPRSVVFTDPMNKFLDDLIDKVDNPAGTGIIIDLGSVASAANAIIDLGSL